MKIIRQVSEREMKERFPDIMEAFNSSDADYCNNCDGLRIHHKYRKKDETWECKICGSRRTKNLLK